MLRLIFKKSHILATVLMAPFAICAMEQKDRSIEQTTAKHCAICFDEKPMSNTKQLACGHEYCRECMIDLIDLFKKEHQLKFLECPDAQCKQTFTEYDIEELTGADRSVIELLEQIKLQEWIAQQPDAKQCPTPDCKYMFLSDNQNKIVTCPSCEHEYCSNCLMLHNTAEISCAAHKSSIQTDKESLQWKYNNTKPCPRCERSVEKNGGCQFINCTHCKKEFCWECLYACETAHQPHQCNPITIQEANKKFMVPEAVVAGQPNDNNAPWPIIAPVAQAAPAAAAIPNPIVPAMNQVPQHALMPYIHNIEEQGSRANRSWKVSICFHYKPMSTGLLDTYYAMLVTHTAVNQYFNALFHGKTVAVAGMSKKYASQGESTIYISLYQRNPNMPALEREDIEGLFNILANEASASSVVWKNQARKYGQ